MSFGAGMSCIDKLIERKNFNYYTVINVMNGGIINEQNRNEEHCQKYGLQYRILLSSGSCGICPAGTRGKCGRISEHCIPAI